MKILFVHPAASISISDVGRGYRSALERAGHEVRDYHMLAHMDYHRRALPEEVQGNAYVVSRQASENVLNEAVYNEVDLVLIISGLNVNPIALWALSKLNIPHAVIFTESPYDDEEQAQWVDLSRHGVPNSTMVFTNDKFSADSRGWGYLPPAFDPAIHRPVPFDPEEACDVLLIGTGWRERQAFLEAVNWDGIDLRLWGAWPQMSPESPLAKFHRPLVVENSSIAKHYCSAKICINFHRRDVNAWTPNPRAYEIAACGAFQLSDPRPGLVELFGHHVPTFESPQELESKIRYYLGFSLRYRLGEESARKVESETFDNRVATLIAAVQDKLAARQLQPV